MQPKVIYSRKPDTTPRRVSIPHFGRFITLIAQNYARTTLGDPTTGLDINISETEDMKDPMLISAETDREWVIEPDNYELWIMASGISVTNLTIEATMTSIIIAQDTPLGVKIMTEKRDDIARIKSTEAL
jgi:hypothetical protein